MRTGTACVVSALFVAAVIAAYSISENGLSVMVFGVGAIAFLYALGTAVVLGLPIWYALKKAGKLRPIYFAFAGTLVGAVFAVGPMAHSRGADPSLLKLSLILIAAGFFAGLIFGRMSLSKTC